jgi:cytochrome c oxidase cbb3-type subunit 2
MVPESLMPHYAFLEETAIDPTDLQSRMQTLKTLGVPYTDEEIANAQADLAAQADPNADSAKLIARYPKANIVSGNGHEVTEMDAMVAYLQMLGTLVNFADTNTERLQQ